MGEIESYSKFQCYPDLFQIYPRHKDQLYSQKIWNISMYMYSKGESGTYMCSLKVKVGK